MNASQRERCWEMKETINQFSFEADTALQEHSTNRDLKKNEFGRRLLASLPLGPFGGLACRKCGLCDMAQEQIAGHLEASARCLFDRSDR